MSNKYSHNDVMRASFQMEGAFALFRHVRQEGRNEYLQEDFRGNVIATILEPTINFHSFVEERVKLILNGSAS